MAEVLGSAAAVAQLGVGFVQATTTLLRYAQEYTKAPKEVKAFAYEIFNIAEILELFKDVAGRGLHGTDEKKKAKREDLMWNVHNQADHVLRGIEDLIDRFSMLRSGITKSWEAILERLRWIFAKPDVRALRLNIQMVMIQMNLLIDLLKWDESTSSREERAKPQERIWETKVKNARQLLQSVKLEIKRHRQAFGRVSNSSIGGDSSYDILYEAEVVNKFVARSVKAHARSRSARRRPSTKSRRSSRHNNNGVDPDVREQTRIDARPSLENRGSARGLESQSGVRESTQQDLSPQSEHQRPYEHPTDTSGERVESLPRSEANSDRRHPPQGVNDLINVIEKSNKELRSQWVHREADQAANPTLDEQESDMQELRSWTKHRDPNDNGSDVRRESRSVRLDTSSKETTAKEKLNRSQQALERYKSSEPELGSRGSFEQRRSSLVYSDGLWPNRPSAVNLISAPISPTERHNTESQKRDRSNASRSAKGRDQAEEVEMKRSPISKSRPKERVPSASEAWASLSNNRASRRGGPNSRRLSRSQSQKQPSDQRRSRPPSRSPDEQMQSPPKSQPETPTPSSLWIEGRPPEASQVGSTRSDPRIFDEGAGEDEQPSSSTARQRPSPYVPMAPFTFEDGDIAEKLRWKRRPSSP